MKKTNIFQNSLLVISLMASILGTTKEILAKNIGEDFKKKSDFGKIDNIKKYFAKEYRSILWITKSEDFSWNIYHIYSKSESKVNTNPWSKNPFEELMACKNSAEVNSFINWLDLEKYVELLKIISSKKSDISKKYSSNIEKKKEVQQKFALEMYSAFFPWTKAKVWEVEFLTTIDRLYISNTWQQKMYQPCIWISGPDWDLKIWSCHYDASWGPTPDWRKTVKSNNWGKDDWKWEETSESKGIESKYLNDLNTQVADFEKQITMSWLVVWQNKSRDVLSKSSYNPSNYPKSQIELQNLVNQVDNIRSKATVYMTQIGKYLTTKGVSEENVEEIKKYLANPSKDISKYVVNEPDYKTLKSRSDEFVKAKDAKEKELADFNKKMDQLNDKYIYVNDQNNQLEERLKSAKLLISDKKFDKSKENSLLLIENTNKAEKNIIDLNNVVDVVKETSKDVKSDKKDKIELTKEEKEEVKQQEKFWDEHQKKFYKPAQKAFRSFLESGYDFDSMKKSDLELIMKSIFCNDNLSGAISYYNENKENLNSPKRIKEFIIKFSNRSIWDYFLPYQPSEKYFGTYIIWESDYNKSEVQDVVESFRKVMDKISQ